MTPEPWLLVIHQIPARPLYLRAKFRTLLDRAGAVALKNSVYALPKRPGALERLDAVAAEIRRAGGEAFVCEVRFTDPEDETLLTRSFRDARAAEYREVAAEADAIAGAPARRGADARSIGRRIARLERRLEWTRSVDYFEAAGRKDAEASVRRLERRLSAPPEKPARDARTRSEWTGRTWVTRRGVHVDRIACAWFVRRFLDPGARFRFVGAGSTSLRPDELGFDLPGGAFTHEGDRCSFETLLARTGASTPALQRIAAIVHDIDLKDGKFGHPETAGIERLLGGIIAAHPDDASRLERGATLFEDLHRSLARPPVLAPTAAMPKRNPGRGRKGRTP